MGLTDSGKSNILEYHITFIYDGYDGVTNKCV